VKEYDIGEHFTIMLLGLLMIGLVGLVIAVIGLLISTWTGWGMIVSSVVGIAVFPICWIVGYQAVK
jgi:hypothetical protein